MNEFLHSITCYVLVAFSKFGEATESTYEAGWMFIILIGLNITINILIVIYSLIKDVYLLAKRYYIRCKAKLFRPSKPSHPYTVKIIPMKPETV